MQRTIPRAEAIHLLSAADVARLSLVQRAEQLAIMMLENWSSHPEWRGLPKTIREEFAHGHLIDDPGARRYDRVLRLACSYTYRGATNDFLLNQLGTLGYQEAGIEGEVEALLPCPCCGYCTLDERGGYAICPICWWEDDGQDTPDADQIRGGPNGMLSLTQARINFLQAGISDSQRDDLRAHQQPSNKYVRGRIFELVHSDADGWAIYEVAP